MKISAGLLRWTACAVLGSVAGCAVETGQGGDELVPAGSVSERSFALADDSVTLPAVADATLKALTPNRNFGTARVLDVNRTLVRFDQAALRAALGPTDYLVGARVELQLVRNGLRAGAAARAVSLFRLNKAWSESGATWNCAVDADTGNGRADCSGQTAWSMGVRPPNPWSTPASAAAAIAPRQSGAVSFDVTADVRGYLAGAFANQGWMVQSGALGVFADFADFASRETAIPPRLVLTVRRCSASSCDDGNACTADSCSVDGQCVNTSDPNGASCDDGDACTGGDQCVAGSCNPGSEDLCLPPAVVINEAESSQGVPGDWVELYNAGETSADLSGFVFKDGDDTHVYTLPAGSLIAAGGYLLLEESGFGFGLGTNEAVRLFTPTGELIDSQSWGPHAPTTYGRCPNGAGEFVVTTSVTKGAENDCSIPIPPVVINEAESNGGVPGDWVELLNLGTAAVDLSGFVFKDADDTHVYALPGGSVIGAGGYLVLEEAAFGFGLGQPESVRLFTPDGKLVDTQSWSTHAPSTSYGRCPSGAGSFAITTSVTKGAANDCGGIVLPPVVINEAESNQGVPGDWVELYNAGVTAADLSGFVFKDNDDTHAYTIPSGTVIPAGGYLVLDEAAFGFGLGQPDSARLFAPGGAILIDSQSWTAHPSTSYGRCPNGSGPFAITSIPTKGVPNECGFVAPPVVINEAESSGGVPGDWVELFNPSASPVDLSGYVFKDADDTHVYALPTGSTIAAGGYLVLEEAVFGFGLGTQESVRLFAPGGVSVIDSQSWGDHASTSYGRCPNGTGAFTGQVSVTKGAENDCGQVRFTAWPGGSAVQTVDLPETFASNLSGLSYQPASAGEPAVLWAAQNGPGAIYKLIWDGSAWVPSASDGWGASRLLRYPDGSGGPDAEGLTKAEWHSPAIYVATERNNDASSVSRLSVLRFDTSVAGPNLIATHEWNLTADLPVVGANLGLEAITYIDDAYLVANGFIDESTAAAYDPLQYADHGGGVFFVGIEASGKIYGYVLDHASGGFQQVAEIDSGHVGVMGLEYDREVGVLWAHCDNTCNNRSTVLAVETDPALSAFGHFVVQAAFERPAGLPAEMNNEGIAIAPESECSSGVKPVFWSDDGDTGTHALRAGTLACGPVF